MKSNLRKIVIENKSYFWKFRSIWQEQAFHSTVTVITENDNIQIFIRFKTIDTFTAGSPLNEGLPMRKMEQLYIINLNQPKYIAELIKHINNKITPCTKKSYEFNGNIILNELGYHDIDNYLVNN